MSLIEESTKERLRCECPLWIHDDAFAKDDILVNTAALPAEIAACTGNLFELVGQGASIQEEDDRKRDLGKINSLSGAEDVKGGVQGIDHADLKHGERDVEPETSLNVQRHKQSSCLFVLKDLSGEQRTKQPKLQISMHTLVANFLGFKHRQDVAIAPIDKATNTASHVELSFRDQYLTRADMWRLVISEMSNRVVYKGQKILFMGSVKAQVKQVYVRGQNVPSAYFDSSSKPVFRSESARFSIFIQISKEMWDFATDGSGEIMFNKVINGFLPELFRKWRDMNARHLVSIILFTRMIYEKEKTNISATDMPLNASKGVGTPMQTSTHQDFYRVVVSDMGSGEWVSILHQLKREFKTFLRDVSVQPTVVNASDSPRLAARDAALEDLETPEAVVTGTPCPAIYGNILEAINLGTSQFSADHIDRDLVRTGISIVVVTPGSGIFEVDNDILRMTTEALVTNGIAIDLVCLSRMPLHSVPLFKYRDTRASQLEQRLSKHHHSEESTPKQGNPAFGSFASSRSFGQSPSTYVLTMSTSPRTLPVPTTTKLEAQQWRFAVPHWIDVSFWTGVTDVSLREFDDQKLRRGMMNDYNAMQYNSFVPRIKMYELQMMGIMENEMSNISIRYLHENPIFSNLRRLKSSRSKRSTKAAKSQDADAQGVGEGSEQAQEKSAPTFTPTSIFVKMERDLPISKGERESYKWLDLHDDLTFKSIHDDVTMRALREVGLAAKEPKYKRTKHQQVKDRDSGLPFLGTSLPKTGGSPNSQHTGSGPTSFDKEMAGRASENSPTPSRVPSLQNLDFQRRPTQLSRQVSSGLRRLNAAPPKALASTEVKTFNALSSRPSQPTQGEKGRESESAESTLRGDPRPQPSTPAPSFDRDSLTETTSGADSTSQSDEKDTESRPSEPIAIKPPRTPVISIFDGVARDRRESEKVDNAQAGSFTRQQGHKPEKSSTLPDVQSLLSPNAALAPWQTILNPSNPRKDKLHRDIHLGRWQHVFPRPQRQSTMKWKSLCSPASVPLTTEIFPTPEQFASEYQENPYNISQNEDDETGETSAGDDLMRELVDLRLSQGFQVVVGPAVAEAFGQASLEMVNLFDNNYMVDEGAMVIMSMGNTIHRLQCVTGGDVEVSRYVRKRVEGGPKSGTHEIVNNSLVYYPHIRTTLAADYELRRMKVGAPKEEYNWNYVDSFLAGYEDDLTEHLRYWRARFVFIPVEMPSNSRRPMQTLTEDNEEEIRLEGLRKVTQMWQRHRVMLPEERRYQNPLRQRKDPNPLDIVYQTRDPAAVIAAELDNLPLVESDASAKPTQLFPATETFHRGNINLSNLAQEMQGDKGVTLKDRRWHWRMHYDSFIGAEMTTWLLQNFKDIETREEAVELGNELMRDGLFQHVEKRHQFRDGNYFFQIGPEYRTPRPDSKRGWFSTKKSEKSIPSTPIPESSKESASKPNRARSSSNADDTSNNSGATTPTQPVSGKKLKVELSKMMRFDVDPRKKSYRPEMIDLHYDRLHNPDNCYHVRIDWLNVTSKLIEDAVVNWATAAEKFGLRLVEVPIREAAAITDTHPFRAPYPIELAIQPPVNRPSSYFESNTYAAQLQNDGYFFQKALLRKFNFVLDVEATHDFPANVEVIFSWGTPDYKYSQYIHRSGVLLAQITTEGNFILLANRLYNSRTISMNDKLEKASPAGVTSPSSAAAAGVNVGNDTHSSHSPFSSPLVRAAPDVIGNGSNGGGSGTNFGNVSAYATPENIKNDLEAFCKDIVALERFYRSAQALKDTDAAKVPATPNSAHAVPLATTPNIDEISMLPPLMEAAIPPIGLPPSLAPSPARSQLRAPLPNSARNVTTPSPLALAATTPVSTSRTNDSNYNSPTHSQNGTTPGTMLQEIDDWKGL